jgi:hypothetical protein
MAEIHGARDGHHRSVPPGQVRFGSPLTRRGSLQTWLFLAGMYGHCLDSPLSSRRHDEPTLLPQNRYQGSREPTHLGV